MYPNRREGSRREGQKHARLTYTPPSANCRQLGTGTFAHVEEDLGDLLVVDHCVWIVLNVVQSERSRFEPRGGQLRDHVDLVPLTTAAAASCNVGIACSQPGPGRADASSAPQHHPNPLRPAQRDQLLSDRHLAIAHPLLVIRALLSSGSFSSRTAPRSPLPTRPSLTRARPPWPTNLHSSPSRARRRRTPTGPARSARQLRTRSARRPTHMPRRSRRCSAVGRMLSAVLGPTLLVSEARGE